MTGDGGSASMAASCAASPITSACSWIDEAGVGVLGSSADDVGGGTFD